MEMNMKTGTYTHNDELYNFKFYTNLSVKNKALFVNTVTNYIVDDTSYNSVLRDVIFGYVTIMKFTDIDVSFLIDDETKTLNIDLLEDFLLSTNIVEIIKANAYPTLFDELNTAVNKSIEYKTGIHPNLISDAIVGLIGKIEKKIDGIDLESMMDMARVFGNMGEEFTSENIVNAYSSYMNKQNLDKVAKTKKK